MASRIEFTYFDSRYRATEYARCDRAFRAVPVVRYGTDDGAADCADQRARLPMTHWSIGAAEILRG